MRKALESFAPTYRADSPLSSWEQWLKWIDKNLGGDLTRMRNRAKYEAKVIEAVATYCREVMQESRQRQKKALADAARLLSPEQRALLLQKTDN